jgi:UDP-N-acetyl-D-glucosamine dehydrogenase
MSVKAARAGAFEQARERIEARGAVFGVIGLGYVGLPLAAAMHRAGYPCLGFDVDPGKVESLEAGRNYLRHLGDEMTMELRGSGRFAATTDFSRLREADVIAVCVPTPLGKRREPDLSFVIRSARDIGRSLRAGQVIVLESTTYPGTTREEFLPAIADAAGPAGRGLECGRDFFVAFSPEREDPGRTTHTTATIPKLVGGLDEASTELAAKFYEGGIAQVVRVGSAEVAEAAKLLENIFRCVNIALVNELKQILAPMGIDVWEVVRAASTKPFGFMPFYPGPGLGGHCIPIDPFYLAWKARELGKTTRFIELAGEINTAMPEYVVERLALALNEDGKPVRGSRVLLIGLAYKPDVDDTRETPAAEIIRLLAERGARVSYHDPHVPVFPRMRRHNFSMSSTPLDAAAVRGADCVLIVTDHAAVDYALIGREAPLVVDTRDAMRRAGAGVRARVVKA